MNKLHDSHERFWNFRVTQLGSLAALLLTGVAVACGGSTEDADGTTDAASGGTDSGPNTTGPDSGGSGPTTTGPTTTGPDSGGSGPTTTGADAGGSAGTGGTTNSDCPSVEPAISAACEAGVPDCSYPNCVAPDYRDGHMLTCVNGAWALAQVTRCEGNGDQCPNSPAIQGAACDVSVTPGPCTGVDACGSARNMYCNEGRWSVVEVAEIIPPTGGGGASSVGVAATVVTTTGGIGGECPLEQPPVGQACCPASYPTTCDYLPDSGSDSVGTTGPASAAVGSFTGGYTSAGVTVTTVTTTGGAPVPVSCIYCDAGTSSWRLCD
jgi:hypothetical protein